MVPPRSVRTGSQGGLPALLPPAILVCLVALVGLPWLHPRFNWEAAADAPNHLLRIYAVSHAISQGSLYPRWLPDLYLGYGYPLLNFYAPATYYLGSALRAAGLSVYASFQWSGILALALGATGTFALVRALTRGSRFGAALAAALYLCAPYPFITNLYVRAAIPEALALGLLPWLLLSTHRAIVRPSRRASVALSLAVALLMLTHNVSALIGLPLTAAFAALVLLSHPADRRHSLRTLAVGCGLGLALSAFFWVPALLETSYVQLDLLRGGIYDYRTWLIDPFRSGAAQSSLTFDYSALGRATPEQISPWQLTLWVLTAALCLAQIRRPAAQLALALAALSLVCWLLTTAWSIPLWERLPLLPYVQFPWRFYGPLALTSAIAAACALPARGRVRLPATGAFTLLALALALGSLALRPVPLASAEPMHDVSSHDLTAKEVNRYGMGTTSGGEFLPRTVSWPVEGSTRRGIKIYEDAYTQASWQTGFVRLIRGQAAVTQVHRDQSGIAAEVHADTTAQLAFHQLAFPGWRAYLDGSPTPIGIARYEPLDATLGFMVIDVPAGRHQVEVRFGPTRARHAANANSAAAAVLILGLALGTSRPRVTWPALAGLAVAAGLTAVLVGELHARPGATLRAAREHVVLDIITALQSGAAQARTPSGSGPGLFPPYLDRQFKWVRGDERRWLYMHPPSDVTFRAHIPEHAYFQAGLALAPPSWDEPIGDGVRFILEADPGSGWITLLDRHINPRARGEEQAWNDVWIPLYSLADRDVTLRLRTDHATDPNYDWSGWSNPQIVRYHTARPHPGTTHKW